MFFQKTIKKKVEVKGVGLHSGQACTLVFRPAHANSGVLFSRVDLPQSPTVAVNINNVKATGNATTLGGSMFSVVTVEHCLSALAALRIDNVIIELDGPEIPICDGSALYFFNAILEAGTIELDQPRKYAYITHPLFFGDGEKHAYVAPYNGLRLTCTIEFSHSLIGKQKIDFDVNETSFAREVAAARTFGFLKDVESLRSKGLAKGASLENAVVLDSHMVVNPEGLRFQDEFVRHKAMDALGDLVTLGMPLMGHVTLYKAGHDILHKLVKKILESPECYRHVELGGHFPETASNLI